MELQYGKDNLNQLIAEYKANEVIRKECKSCPNYKAPICVSHHPFFLSRLLNTRNSWRVLFCLKFMP
ncbi:unnamed protein product [Dibothriocephalus latus]|uniref:Uncharacterized protein n=1 Tax=Dibothriocephalus latus TaxID=60516 RepID=A0A3P6S999_DIBLA|nr:unnamed protein product [Dibothriocephalus latus]